MNLSEFRQALESDATKENEKLKKELSELREQYTAMVKENNETRMRLLNDCDALAERCYALTGFQKGDFMCFHCELHGYHCKHEKTLDEKIAFAKKLKGKFK